MCGWYDEDISKIGQQVPESDRRISGKREAGGKPARSRHCKQGAPDYAHVKTAWQPLVFGDWEGNLKCGAASQETCLLLVQEHSRPRGLGRAAGSFQNFSQGCSGHCSWYVPGIPKSIVSVRMVLHHTILEEDIS